MPIFLDKDKYVLNMHNTIYKNKYVDEYSSAFIYIENEDVFIDSMALWFYEKSNYNIYYVPYNCQLYQYGGSVDISSGIESYINTYDKSLISTISAVEFFQDNKLDVLILSRQNSNYDVSIDKVTVTINSVLSNNYTFTDLTVLLNTNLDNVISHYGYLIPIVNQSNNMFFAVVGEINLGTQNIKYIYNRQMGLEYVNDIFDKFIRYINIMQNYTLYDCYTKLIVSNNDNSIVGHYTK